MIPPTHQKSFECKAGTIPKKCAPTMNAITGMTYCFTPSRFSNAIAMKIATNSSTTKIP